MSGGHLCEAEAPTEPTGDAARFIFGNKTNDIIRHDGELTIDCVICLQSDTSADKQQTASKRIPQGHFGYYFGKISVVNTFL